MNKNLKDAAAAASFDIISTIAQGTQDTSNTKNTNNINDRQSIEKKAMPVKKKPEIYRFNLNMPLEYKEYLQKAAFKASSPDKTVTITEYICSLIKADMER